jgi:hypothetical protein
MAGCLITSQNNCIMAQVEYGSLVTRINGKVGGHVFQRCGQTLSLRNKAAVKFSTSEDSLLTRSDFSQIANAWRALTDEERNSFTYYANTYPTFDRLGNPVVLSAYQLFIYLNRSLVALHRPLLTTCTPYVAPSLTVPTIGTCSVSGHSFPVSVLHYNATNELSMLYMTGLVPLNYASTSPKTKFVQAFSFYAGFPENKFDYINNEIPGGVIAGFSQYFEWWSINRNTGCFVFDKSQVITWQA